MPPGRPMIVGTGRESTRRRSPPPRRAAAAGADAVLVRTPSFFKAQMTRRRASSATTREVADASPVPVLLYNVTMFTGVTLQVEAVARLGRAPEHRRHEGIGQRHRPTSPTALPRTPDDFTMLAGSATTYFHALCAGCDGGVLALASLLPGRLRAPAGARRDDRRDRRGARSCSSGSRRSRARSAAPTAWPD